MNQAIKDGITQVGVAMISLLAAFLMYGIQRGAQKLKSETSKINDEKERQLANAAIDKLNDVTVKTVNKIEQTTAKDLRVAVKNGTAKKEDLMVLADQAYHEILVQMGPEWMDVIYKELGDAEQYILNSVETQVLQLKPKS